MRHVSPSYFNQPVGEQLLQHYARRDAVRHATPLLPFRFGALFSFLQRKQSGNSIAASQT
jgi:hypothetical protein